MQRGDRTLRTCGSGVMMLVIAFVSLLVSSAGAAEWHANGDRAFSSTSAGAARFVLHPTGGGPVIVECASSTVTGTLSGSTSSASVFANVASITPVAGGPCSVSGVPGYFVACATASLNAIGYTGGTTFATAGGGVTTASITSIDCKFSIGSMTCSTVTGSAHGHYVNANPIGSGSGRLTLTAAGQSLTVSKIGAGCAALPHGIGTFGSPNAGSSIGDITYSVDGPNAPWMFRTP